MLPIITALKTRLRDRRILHLMTQARALSERADYNQAYRFYRQAAELGCVRAICIMGMMFYHGQGVPKNESMAFLSMKFCAGKQDAEAQYFLGEFYRLGIGTKRDNKEALYWLQESAASGQRHESQLEAQYKLACMLLHGQGIEPNPEMALYWFTEAANDGYEPAKAFLTNCMPGYVSKDEKKNV